MRTLGFLILALLAPASLGFTTGWLTGQSGPDATVLAAILPAVITGGGWALLAYKIKLQGGTWNLALKHQGRAWNVEYAAISAMVVAFSVFLLVGAHTGRYVREVAEMSKIEERWKLAGECSRRQFLVNKGRKALGQDPLPTEVFCFPDISSPRAPSGD